MPDGRGNVDHLVMGPNGLFAIETKNYSTFVKCSGDDWFVNGKKIRSLSKQAKRNAIAVRETGGRFCGPRKPPPIRHCLACFRQWERPVLD